MNPKTKCLANITLPCQVSFLYSQCHRERERGRGRDRQTGRQTETEAERGKERERERELMLSNIAAAGADTSGYIQGVLAVHMPNHRYSPS